MSLNKKLNLKVLEDTGLADDFGFDLTDDEINDIAGYSLALINKEATYEEVAEELYNKCGSRFLYREGNKRIVLVNDKKDYVIKIAKLPGWEGIENNDTEFKSTLSYHQDSAYKKSLYAPFPIMLIGTKEYPGLIFIQEKHTEIIEGLASKLRIVSKMSKGALEKALISEVITKSYKVLKTMIEEISEEFFLDDTPFIASSANYGFNSKGGISILDWGSIVPKDGYEARCPECGAPMIFEVESLSAITKSGKTTLAAESIRPKYVCVSTMNDPVGRHDLDTDVFYQRLRKGDEEVIMTAKESIKAVEEIKDSQIDKKSKFKHKGETYFLGKDTVIYDEEEVYKIYDEDGEFTGFGMNEKEEFIEMT